MKESDDSVAVHTCTRCLGDFNETEGTWPAIDWDGNIRPDLTGDRDVFWCYECLEQSTQSERKWAEIASFFYYVEKSGVRLTFDPNRTS